MKGPRPEGTGAKFGFSVMCVWVWVAPTFPIQPEGSAGVKHQAKLMGRIFPQCIPALTPDGDVTPHGRRRLPSATSPR
jgi:hypothetical protein